MVAIWQVESLRALKCLIQVKEVVVLQDAEVGEMWPVGHGDIATSA